jgi:hypothetical protein
VLLVGFRGLQEYGRYDEAMHESMLVVSVNGFNIWGCLFLVGILFARRDSQDIMADIFRVCHFNGSFRFNNNGPDEACIKIKGHNANFRNKYCDTMKSYPHLIFTVV